MSLRERVPKPLRGPAGFGALSVMITGLAVGYILTMTGVTLYFDMNSLDPGTGEEAVTKMESLGVTAAGLVALVAGYFGWKGFTYFAY